MKFWDSSALVPLIVEEARSIACRALYRGSPAIVVWTFTRTEILSALHRKERAHELAARDMKVACRRLDLLTSKWREVDASMLVRDRAERLLALHPLHVADSLQLAAALIATDDRPRGHSFVTCDTALASGAAREGFDVNEPS
jgi:predicted nucleic acid-binding protein